MHDIRVNIIVMADGVDVEHSVDVLHDDECSSLSVWHFLIMFCLMLKLVFEIGNPCSKKKRFGLHQQK